MTRPTCALSCSGPTDLSRANSANANRAAPQPLTATGQFVESWHTQTDTRRGTAHSSSNAPASGRLESPPHNPVDPVHGTYLRQMRTSPGTPKLPGTIAVNHHYHRHVGTVHQPCCDTLQQRDAAYDHPPNLVTCGNEPDTTTRATGIRSPVYPTSPEPALKRRTRFARQ
jgi:hypothetical protein